MKKRICLCLVLLLAVGLTACGKQTPKTTSTDSSIFKTNVSTGKIPEMEFTVGTDPDALIGELKNRSDNAGKDAEGVSEAPYNVLEKEDYKKITNGTFAEFEYYYKPNGHISCIATNETAFGFKKMTVTSEVEGSFPELTPKAQDGVHAFFLPAGEVCDCLTYDFGEYAVTFAFIQSGLTATAVYETAEWSIG